MTPQSENGKNYEEEAAEMYCANGLHFKHCFHWENAYVQPSYYLSLFPMSGRAKVSRCFEL